MIGLRESIAAVAICVALGACRDRGPTLVAGDPALSTKAGLLLYRDQPFTGVVRSTIPAMAEVEIAEFRMGFQHGMTRKETTDGKLLAEWPYFAGAKHGIHKTWDREGHLITYSEFRRGSYVGEAWSWYPSGKPYDYRRYNEKGELLIARRWRPTGQIYMNQVFRNGAAIGMPGSKLCNPTNAERSDAQATKDSPGLPAR